MDYTKVKSIFIKSAESGQRLMYMYDALDYELLIIPETADCKVKGVIGKREKLFICYHSVGGASGRGHARTHLHDGCVASQPN